MSGVQHWSFSSHNSVKLQLIYMSILYFMLEQPVVYSYLMGVQAIDQNIFPEVLVFPNTERILFKTKTALKRNTKAQRCPYTSKWLSFGQFSME